MRRGDGSRRAAGAIPVGLYPMLSFSVTATIGCVLAAAPDELTRAISSVFDRSGQPLRVAWMLCATRERSVRAKILDHLREGDLVRVEGEIEQQRRQVGELVFHSVDFVIRSIERWPSPISGVPP